MTKKISISVPDDVAEHLSHVSNVSAYITEAIMQRRRSERLREKFRRLGYEVTDEGVAKWRERLENLKRRKPEEGKAT